MGDGELLCQLGLQDYILSNDETFLTFFVTCSDDVIDFKNLQQRILNAFRDFSTQAVETGSETKRVLVDQQSRRKISFKFFEAEQTNHYKQRLKELNLDDLSLTEQIKREADLLLNCYGQRALVILDELDRIGDTKGLASFLKTMSGEQLKFALVGIAQSLSDLGLDHKSVGRNLWPVRVPRMTPAELGEIVDRALGGLQEHGYNYSFTDSARSNLVKAAGGFPWFVHVIGQSALIAALSAQKSEVTSELLKGAIKGLAMNRFAQNFKDSYQVAVRDSFNREIVLRSFAHWGFTDMPTRDVYAIARKLGVKNPAVYKGHLTSEHYGAPLVAPGFQEQGILRFRDEMFKQYVKLAPSFYKDVDSDVRQAYESY